MRSPEDVQAEALALSPPGQAFPRDPASNWGKMLLPLAKELSRVEGLAEALLHEIDPRQAQYLLAEWAALVGPDPYGRDISGYSTGQMQAYLYQRLVSLGGQSRAFYLAVAAALGVTITIEEFQTTIYGAAVYGSAIYSETPVQFYWRVTVPASPVTNAVYGSARYGDPYGSVEQNPIVPVIQSLAPAHTIPIFSYTG
ncbi:putative phage tail protein [Acidocella sp.]|uniref:putative phage tail protein n=1 Tax=Acidocella sp. TaxID=50710 RepID=UPI00260763C4|nr:putative phage tail protein [Acidocella sp.]